VGAGSIAPTLILMGDWYAGRVTRTIENQVRKGCRRSRKEETECGADCSMLFALLRGAG